MKSKTKESLSGNLKTPVVSFVNRTKTNHNSTYNRKLYFYLVHKSCCGDRRSYERYSICKR